ncbi:MAG: hypothetical protein WBW62_03185 [Solirubrobacterales bacterium]
MKHGTVTFSGIKLKTVNLTVLALVVSLVGVLAFAAGPAEAGGKVKQSNCKKLSKKLKKAKGKNAKLRLKYNLKGCKNSLKVYNKVKNSRFIGVRSDGQPIDITLCANGKAADDVGTEFEQVYRKGWIIEGGRYKNKKNFEGGFAAKIGANSDRAGSIKFGKNGWEVGISSFDGTELYNYGPAKKSNARKICSKL